MSKKKLWLCMFVLAVGAIARPVCAADAGAAQEPGLLDINFYSAVWVLISFILLLIILKKAAWKNLLDSLKGREERIRNDIKQAEEARAKAEAALKEHMAKLAGAEAQVRDIIAKGAADAEKIAASIKAQAQADAEAEREKSRKDIADATRDAMRQVYEKTADLATNVAAKIIKRELKPQDQQDLVDETIGQIEKMQLGAR